MKGIASADHASTPSLQSTATTSSATPLLAFLKGKGKQQAQGDEASNRRAPVAPPQNQSRTQPKNYEEAFANLSSSYGYAGISNKHGNHA